MSNYSLAHKTTEIVNIGTNAVFGNFSISQGTP